MHRNSLFPVLVAPLRRACSQRKEALLVCSSSNNQAFDDFSQVFVCFRPDEPLFNSLLDLNCRFRGILKDDETVNNLTSKFRKARLDFVLSLLRLAGGQAEALRVEIDELLVVICAPMHNQVQRLQVDLLH